MFPSPKPVRQGAKNREGLRALEVDVSWSIFFSIAPGKSFAIFSALRVRKSQTISIPYYEIDFKIGKMEKYVLLVWGI